MVGKAWLTGSEAVLCHPAQDELKPTVAFYKTLFTKMLVVSHYEAQAGPGSWGCATIPGFFPSMHENCIFLWWSAHVCSPAHMM